MKLTDEMRAALDKAIENLPMPCADDEPRGWEYKKCRLIFLAGYRLGVQDAAKKADAYSSDADYCEAFRVAKLLARAIRSLIEETNG